MRVQPMQITNSLSLTPKSPVRPDPAWQPARNATRTPAARLAWQERRALVRLVEWLNCHRNQAVSLGAYRVDRQSKLQHEDEQCVHAADIALQLTRRRCGCDGRSDARGWKRDTQVAGQARPVTVGWAMGPSSRAILLRPAREQPPHGRPPPSRRTARGMAGHGGAAGRGV